MQTFFRKVHITAVEAIYMYACLKICDFEVRRLADSLRNLQQFLSRGQIADQPSFGEMGAQKYLILFLKNSI